MKNENTATRLKKIMNDRNLRQIDILNLSIPYCEKYEVKMNKSDISQYCAGKTEPNQNKLFVLGKALNVNEAWLMGYDVPMERIDEDAAKKYKEQMKNYAKKWNNQYFEKKAFESFSQLNDVNKKKVIDYSQNLLNIQIAEEEQRHLIPKTSHERTDVEVTEEMKKHDDTFFEE
ncbi:transcriptional regulator [Lacrimispora aerotolerans]|uniref:transcriptional regulator n=1 Tax=Lacrimispora aerotolerans TaxID=36832 RepID=UPI00047E07DC|nr:transcriptional regulator [Lacrimispora aerotolerans]